MEDDNEVQEISQEEYNGSGSEEDIHFQLLTITNTLYNFDRIRK